MDETSISFLIAGGSFAVVQTSLGLVRDFFKMRREEKNGNGGMDKTTLALLQNDMAHVKKSTDETQRMFRDVIQGPDGLTVEVAQNKYRIDQLEKK